MAQNPPHPAKKRRLVALMFTDIVGYSSLASKDEALALRLLEEHRSIFRRIFPSYGGRENKTIGDAFFIEFGSAVDALQCAIEIQTSLYERNAFAPLEKSIRVRIGLHLGDVIEHAGDTYGDGVNIAARVEGLAPAGGICMTRQVLDQVTGKVDVKLTRVGRIELKNISAPTDIHRVVFPWEKRRYDRKRDWLFSWARTFLGLFRKGAPASIQNRIDRVRGTLAAVQAAVILAAVALTLSVTLRNVREPHRTPASATPRISLESGWKWTTKPDSGPWHDFDPLHPWKSADEISGEYWLRTEFKLRPSQRFVHPAIVLGPIAREHRAFLNGEFIGGSDLFTDIAHYSFDSGALNPDGPNELLIRAETPLTANPGLNLIPQVGAFLGEFEDVYAATIGDRIRYHALRAVFLAISLLISAASFAYYLWHKEDRKFLYYGLFLLLGSLALAYHNLYVVQALDFRHARYIKILSLSLSSFMLLSAHLAQRKKRSLELANNLGALGVSVVIAALSFLGAGVLPSRYLDRYNEVLTFALSYTVIWFAVLGASVIGHAWKDLRRGRSRAERGTIRMRHDLLIVAFGALSACLLYSSLKTEASLPWLGASHFGIENFGMLGPVAFSLLLVVSGIRDYVRKSRRVIYKKSRDELVLSIVRIAGEHSSIMSALPTIQDMLCRFIGADRSTLYLIENTSCLKASFIFGEAAGRHFVRSELPTTEGVVGYVLETKTPLLIHDIRKDLRFSRSIRDRVGASSYSTGACMIFPLSAWGQNYGVLTLADRHDGRSFTRDDFALVHVISKTLALVIANDRANDRANDQLVRKQKKKSIA